MDGFFSVTYTNGPKGSFYKWTAAGAFFVIIYALYYYAVVILILL